jgi:hypothetical protein
MTNQQTLMNTDTYKAFVVLVNAINANTAATITIHREEGSYLQFICKGLGTVLPALGDDISIDGDYWDKSFGIAYNNGDEGGYSDFDLILDEDESTIDTQLYDTRGFEVITIADMHIELERIYNEKTVQRFCTSGRCNKEFEIKISEFEDGENCTRCKCEHKNYYSLD